MVFLVLPIISIFGLGFVIIGHQQCIPYLIGLVVLGFLFFLGRTVRLNKEYEVEQIKRYSRVWPTEHDP